MTCAIPPLNQATTTIGRGYGRGWNRRRTSANELHAGMDFVADRGTPVLAATPGRVRTVSHDEKPAPGMSGYGNAVVLEHDLAIPGLPRPFWTLYAHLSEITVQPGQLVETGMLIGRVGNTNNGQFPGMGAHLHFEVRVRPPPSSYSRDTRDPAILFQALGIDYVGWHREVQRPVGGHLLVRAEAVASCSPEVTNVQLSGVLTKPNAFSARQPQSVGAQSYGVAPSTAIQPVSTKAAVVSTIKTSAPTVTFDLKRGVPATTITLTKPASTFVSTSAPAPSTPTMTLTRAPQFVGSAPAPMPAASTPASAPASAATTVSLTPSGVRAFESIERGAPPPPSAPTPAATPTASSTMKPTSASSSTAIAAGIQIRTATPSGGAGYVEPAQLSPMYDRYGASQATDTTIPEPPDYAGMQEQSRSWLWLWGGGIALGVALAIIGRMVARRPGP